MFHMGLAHFSSSFCLFQRLAFSHDFPTHQVRSSSPNLPLPPAIPESPAEDVHHIQHPPNTPFVAQ